MIVVILFSAVTLRAELTIRAPSVNDDAYHYAMISRASEALSSGQSLIDHWLPVVDVGFPLFLYYQHLPHITVVLLDQVLLQQVDLLDVFNFQRYFLLVTFPITVYWSMRKLEFSRPAAMFGAAASPLLSGAFRYGFDYDSYIWRGFGLYTQIWGMHLSFILLACVNTTIVKGTGRTQSIVAWSLMILSHFLYSYIMAFNTVIAFLLGLQRKNALPRARNLAIVSVCAALITLYVTTGFFLSGPYLNISPYLQQYKYDSFGLRQILDWLVSGDLLDHGRLPVLTVFLGLGIVLALIQRTRPAILCLLMLVFWLVIYAGPKTWGSLTNIVPLNDSMLYHRFIGGVEIAAIPLIGLGGEAVWRACRRLGPYGAVVSVTLLMLCMVPALRERSQFYSLNATWMQQTVDALNADVDQKAIIARLKTLPPGRTYAGLRFDAWAPKTTNAFVTFPDMLTFNGIEEISSPYGGASLTSDLLWDFDYKDLTDYRVFNVRYVVAPASEKVPDFLTPIMTTPRYILYQRADSSYFSFGISPFALTGSTEDFHPASRAWLHSQLARDDSFPTVYLDGGPKPPLTAAAQPLANFERLYANLGNLPPRPAIGTIKEEVSSAQEHGATVFAETPGMLVLKVSYHPHWKATVDGKKVDTVMVMPDYVGIPLEVGTHTVDIRYEASTSRSLLFYFGLVFFVLLIAGKLAVQFRDRRRLREPASETRMNNDA